MEKFKSSEHHKTKNIKICSEIDLYIDLGGTMRPIVSIVIPIYNVEKYIKKCVDSVINQTYKELEIILVNDGSPDNCGEIANQYKEEDPRIKVIHKKNGGLSDARNAGLEVVTGEYLCFIDSDDYIEFDAVEVLLSNAINTNSDVVVCSYFNEKVDINENILSKEPVNLQVDNLSSMAPIIGYAWNKLYKTSFIKKHKLKFVKGLSLVEDIVFNEKVFLNTSEIIYINLPLYHYINRDRPSLIKQYHENSFELQKLGFKSREKVMLKLFENHSDVREVIAGAYVSGVRYCLSNLFYYKNSLSSKRKYKIVETIISEEMTMHQIKSYKPVNVSDKIIKFALFYQLPSLLFLTYNIRSFFSK